MATPKIFISYRRDDATGYARAVADALGRQFGADQVFIDVDDIGAGRAFDEVIGQAVAGSTVLLVLIGRRWAGPREGRPPRLHDADDLVRQEVASALQRPMTVIPVLLDGTPMPGADTLPDDVQPLARRHALELSNSRFAPDIDRLVAVLRPLLGPAEAGGPAATPAPRPARWGLALAGALLLAGALWWGLGGRAPAPPGPAAGHAAAPAAAARAAVNGRWVAEVPYEWLGTALPERFDFAGTGAALQGSASFLRVDRAIEQGRVGASGLQFSTRSSEVAGGTTRETEHRYQGELVGGELQFTLQTLGGSTPHPLLRFVARRADAATGAPNAAAAR